MSLACEGLPNDCRNHEKMIKENAFKALFNCFSKVKREKWRERERVCKVRETFLKKQ